MIAWYVGLNFATKAFIATLTFIVGWCLGLRWAEKRVDG